MNLELFIEHIKNTKTLPMGKVFCFSVQTYPLLFFYYLINFLKKNGLRIERLNCYVEVATIKSMLSTISFSGQIFYWLDDFHTLSDKKQEEIMLYLSTYDGPHKVLFFSDKG